MNHALPNPAYNLLSMDYSDLLFKLHMNSILGAFTSLTTTHCSCYVFPLHHVHYGM